MRKTMKLFLVISFLFVFVGCSNDNHHSQGVLFETSNQKAIEYEKLDELILASDLIIEARVLDDQEVIENPSYPRTTVSTLYLEDVLYAKDNVNNDQIKLIEHGDYRYHLDIVQDGEKHILFLMEVKDSLDELLPLMKDFESHLEESPYVAVDQWQGKYNITDEKTTYFYAEKDQIKPFQEELSNLSHQLMKEEIRTAIAKLH